MTGPALVPERLAAYLDGWLGVWPPATDREVTVVASTYRDDPGWDGKVHPVFGVATPQGTVLSVPTAALDQVRALGDSLARIGPLLAETVGRPDLHFGRGAFRWCVQPAPFSDAGEWVPPQDERVPDWLKPFNGDVLVAWDDEGRYVGGVGRKIHDHRGHELSVGTEPNARNKGLARRLVAQAARRVLADGAVPIYLHDHANVASAHVAAAVGFHDVGWEVVSLFG